MEAARLIEITDRCGLKFSSFARLMGCSRDRIEQWRRHTNRVAIPADVAEWLERLDAWYADNPPPKFDTKRKITVDTPIAGR